MSEYGVADDESSGESIDSPVRISRKWVPEERMNKLIFCFSVSEGDVSRSENHSAFHKSKSKRVRMSELLDGMHGLHRNVACDQTEEDLFSS